MNYYYHQLKELHNEISTPANVNISQQGLIHESLVNLVHNTIPGQLALLDKSRNKTPLKQRLIDAYRLTTHLLNVAEALQSARKSEAYQELTIALPLLMKLS